MDLLISMAVNVLLETMKDKAAIRKIKPKLAKVYKVLHENRALFLSDKDFALLVQPPTKE